jgi:hypothetical protein
VLPQVPQFFGSIAISTQASLQRAIPAGQVHVPWAQARPAGHAEPQVPQFVASFVKSTQPEPHFDSPIAQAAWHAPFEQVSAVSQTCPHEPQFAASAERSKQPFPHAVFPVAHCGGGGGTQSPSGVHRWPVGHSESLWHVTAFPPQLGPKSAAATTAKTPKNRENVSPVKARQTGNYHTAQIVGPKEPEAAFKMPRFSPAPRVFEHLGISPSRPAKGL